MSRPQPPVSVVGMGADGWDGLSPRGQAVIASAGVVIGAARQLGLLPTEVTAQRITWGSPLRPTVRPLLEEHRPAGLVVLASGDPMWHGIGRTLVEEIGAEALDVISHPSSVSLACAALGWAVEQTEVVSLVTQEVSSVLRAAHDGARAIVLSQGALTPGAVAELLQDSGFGPSVLTVLTSLGAPTSRRIEGMAQGWAAEVEDPLNVIGVEFRRDESAPRLGATPGLPDEAFENDGQLTKREVRAVTLSALAPAPGELLWDVGGGAGSIGVEWMRAARGCRAIAVERNEERADRIGRNASRLGVPSLEVVQGAAPQVLTALPEPDAVFIGGGLTSSGVVDACWKALPEGGRLVANAVTLESQADLVRWRERLGGELTRIEVARSTRVGTFTGWRPAMPVVQWSVVKSSVAQQDSEPQ